MTLNFFWIPALDASAAAAELNAFLATHRVVRIEKQFCLPGSGDPGWSICVESVSGERSRTAPGTPRPSKVDYKQVLDADTFEFFAALRQWRKETAAAGGVPVYTVATNEQLAEVARHRMTTRGALEKIEGFGQARLERYGTSLLAECGRLIDVGKEER